MLFFRRKEKYFHMMKLVSAVQISSRIRIINIFRRYIYFLNLMGGCKLKKKKNPTSPKKKKTLAKYRITFSQKGYIV